MPITICKERDTILLKWISLRLVLGGSDAYAAIRGREQQMIDYFGGVGSENVGNRIRGVSKTNPWGRTYHTKSNQMFGQLHQYTGF